MGLRLISCLLIVCSMSSAIPAKEDSKRGSNVEKNLADAIASFSINLMKTLHLESSENENVLFSPINIYAALALTHLGSSNSTREKLGSILHIPSDDNHPIVKVHEYIGKFMKSFVSKDKEDQHFQYTLVNMLNGIFIQKDYPIKSTYLDQAKSFYDAQALNLDFSGDGQGATNAINKWVSEGTKNRIPQIFSSPLSSLTTVVICTTLYFNGKWNEWFPSTRTKLEKFNTGVNEIDVQMMNHQFQVRYFKHTLFESIELPYDRNEYALCILLPTSPHTVEQLTQQLTAKDLQQVFSDAKETAVDYKVPRMKFSKSKSLKPSLSKLGLEDIFQSVDLSNMVSGVQKLQVADIIHAAEIDIDEEGTTATAITAVQMQLLSAKRPPTNPIPFYVKKPFMMVLYHRSSSTILFTAVVHQPNV